MYGLNHQYFLQFMLKNGYIPTEKALQFTKNISEDINDLNSLKAFLVPINQQISNQELKIVLTTCEITGIVGVALLNTINDDISKLQRHYTAAEVEYFQHLLKEIIVSEEHKLPKMSCLNITNLATKSLRIDNMENLLDKWMNEGYLVENESFIYLGPRCILEFSPYFTVHSKDHYKQCHLCSEPAFVGQSCSCDKLMHNHCIEKWLIKNKKCPNCKRPWTESNNRRSAVDMEEDSD